MKILHLSTQDLGGGAARGAYWLHRALSQKVPGPADPGGRRVSSQMLVQQKTSDDPSVLRAGGRMTKRVAVFADQLALAAYPGRRPSIFSPAVLPLAVSRQVNALRPDVVNLHWVQNGFLTPEDIARVRAPLVWTLRDQWALTGGCHYSGDCRRYEANCGACPALGSRRDPDLSSLLFGRKRRAFAGLARQGRPITLVALSHWLADLARRSPLFGGSEVLVIPNALDEEVYRPVPRAVARAALNWPQNRPIALFSAFRPLIERRKGFPEWQQALALMMREGDTPGTAGLLGAVVGELAGPPPTDTPTEMIFTGGLHDDLSLALAYAAADLTVVPSREEAFGKVAMESLACGTPVVCFDAGGLSDVVDHLQNGYRARLGDVADLAAGMKYVLNHPDPAALAAAARSKVLEHYTFAVQARQYVELYSRLMEREAAPVARVPA